MYHREWRQRRRGERLGEFVSAVNRSRRNRATYRLVEATAKCFGGPEGLAEAWHQAIEQVRQRKPGSAELTRNYRAILALGTAIYEATKRHPEPAVSRPPFAAWLKTATDEELEEAIAQELARIVGQCQDDAELEDDLTPAAPEAESDEDTDPHDAGGCGFAAKPPPR